MNKENIAAGFGDRRMKLRGMLTTLGGAITITVTVLFPEINPTVIAAWGSFYQYAVQFGESYYDNKPSPLIGEGG